MKIIVNQEEYNDLVELDFQLRCAIRQIIYEKPNLHDLAKIAHELKMINDVFLKSAEITPYRNENT